MRTAEGCAAAAKGFLRGSDPCGLAFGLQPVIGELGAHWETPPVYAIVKGIPGLPLGVHLRHVKPLPSLIPAVTAVPPVPRHARPFGVKMQCVALAGCYRRLRRIGDVTSVACAPMARNGFVLLALQQRLCTRGAVPRQISMRPKRRAARALSWRRPDAVLHFRLCLAMVPRCPGRARGRDSRPKGASTGDRLRHHGAEG